MNPTDMIRIMSMKKRFEENHPKVAPFFRAVSSRGLAEGSVVEIRVTPPNGETLTSNIRVCAEDLEFLRELTGSLGEKRT